MGEVATELGGVLLLFGFFSSVADISCAGCSTTLLSGAVNNKGDWEVLDAGNWRVSKLLRPADSCRMGVETGEEGAVTDGWDSVSDDWQMVKGIVNVKRDLETDAKKCKYPVSLRLLKILGEKCQK